MKFNLAVIQSFLAPALTPVPAALLLASKIYGVLLANVGWLAWVGAVAGFAGLESLGGLTCYAAIKAYRRRDWGSFRVAALLVGIYISAGVSSVLWLEHSDAQILAWGFVLTVAAYIAYAMIQDVWDSQAETDREIALVQARTRLTNAETRRAKTEQIVYPKSFGVRSEAEQAEQSDLQAKIFAILDDDASIGPREMARRAGCAPSTAKGYIDRWKK
jgi:hypothetical protein